MLARLAFFVASSVLLTTALGAPASAAAAERQAPATVSTVYSATLVEEHEDYQDHSHAWSGADRFELTRPSQDRDGAVAIDVVGGPGDDYPGDRDAGFWFRSTPGEALVPGVYDVPREGSTSSQDPHPGMAVDPPGDCAFSSGRFTVHEVDLEAGRLWVDFVGTCWPGGPSAYGEVRLGVQAPTADGLLAPAAVTWPEIDLGDGSPTADLLVQNTGPAPVRVDGVGVWGRDATDFTVSTGCGVVAPGERCPVSVDYRPREVGPRSAELVLDATGPTGPTTLTTALAALPVAGGSTRLDLTSDPGDYVLDGDSLTYTADDGLYATYSRGRVVAGFGTLDPDLQFAAGDGTTLTEGTYRHALRYPFNDGSPGLDVSGFGRGCNKVEGAFVVHEIAFRDGLLSAFSASFEQHCDGDDPGLRGQVSWRASEPPPAKAFPTLDLQVDRAAYDRGDVARGVVTSSDLPAGTRVRVRSQALPGSGKDDETVAQGVVGPGSSLRFDLPGLAADVTLVAKVVDGVWPASDAARVEVRPEIWFKALRPYRPVGGVPHYRPGKPATIAVKMARRYSSVIQPRLQVRRGGAWRPTRDPARFQLKNGRGTWTFERPALRGEQLRVRFAQVTSPGDAAGRSGWVRFVLER